jgi:hypothetical protein
MSIGAEKRGNILPMEEPSGMGFLGPDYSYVDELIRPAQIGVRRNDTLGSVFDAARGVAYYMDTIAFGESSTGLTSRLPFKKYGVNYFIKTGAKCSNGADMWHYMELIPKGDALGKTVSLAMEEIGLGPMRGLAPGAIEDIKAAVNVAPALKSIFGSGYPKCKLVNLPVGDETGKIQNSQSGEFWVDDPKALRPCPWNRRRPCQTKWVLDKMVGKKEWDADKKIFNPDGTPAKQTFPKEGFSDFECLPNIWLLVALLGITAANFWAYKRR